MSWLRGTSPDPQTTNRDLFTQFSLSQTPPDSADPRYKKLCLDFQSLLSLLLNHPSMVENNKQTYMTPAARKSKVYFMWDFVGRTLSILFNVDPSLPKRSRVAWKEVMGRAAMGAMLIEDTSGRLDMMSRGPGYDESVEFGREIVEVARRMG